jgi:CelD/BcsL family acetyltransferase involved in cellulose biosynthesis
MKPQIQVLSGFDAPEVGRERWNALLRRGSTDVVFMTWEWQRAWWEAFGRGRLLLLAAERDGELTALAPLFLDGGMLFFTGSGGSDYLDFVGDVSTPAVLDALLEAAREAVPDVLGFRFYHVPDVSSTGGALASAAARMGWILHDEGELPAPALDMGVGTGADRGLAAADKRSLVRHQRRFEREGVLRVEQLRESQQIEPHLDAFFRQHEERWSVTPYLSLFRESRQRYFYQRATLLGAAGGWLRFTRVLWNEAPIAFHFGFFYRGSYLWYKPSFAIALARWSPGEVLLRQLLLAALAEGARTFDFGLGDEAFKRRFATRVPRVRTWGLYPSASARTGEDPATS